MTIEFAKKRTSKKRKGIQKTRSKTRVKQSMEKIAEERKVTTKEVVAPKQVIVKDSSHAKSMFQLSFGYT